MRQELRLPAPPTVNIPGVKLKKSYTLSIYGVPILRADGSEVTKMPSLSREDSGLINTQVLSSALHLNTVPPTPHSVPAVTCHPRETCCPSSCPLSYTSGHILIRHPVSARHVLFNLRHPPATLYQVSHFLTWSPMNVSGTLGLILATTTENSPTGHGSHTHTHLTKALRWFAVPLISTLQLLPMPRGFLILNFIVWIYQLPLTSQHFPKF